MARGLLRVEPSRPSSVAQESETNMASWTPIDGDDIADLILHDHRHILHLVDKLEQTKDTERGARLELFAAMHLELRTHTEAEDAVLYDRLSQSLDENRRNKIRAARGEHALIDRVVGELASLDPSHSFWKVKVRVLRDFLEHHFADEARELEVAKLEFDAEESMNLAQAFLFAKRKFLMLESDSVAPPAISLRNVA